MKRIALLGAESTGKTRLAGELAAHLRGRGLCATVVPEVLRRWCSREEREPQPGERLAIAQEQERQVDGAARAFDVVVADTTAVMVAVYAGLPHEDGELLRFALQRQRAYDATLVTGLDLPWVADGVHRDTAQPRDAVDGRVRLLLQRAQVPFHVVYGQGPQRLESALRALVSAGVLPADTLDRESTGGAARNWVWACEKCSDPACEHRLFTQLRGARASR